MLISAEIHLGLVKLARRNAELAKRWWGDAIRDQRSIATADTPTDVVPNRGLDLLIAGKYRAGFAWFADTYSAHTTQEDPSLIDDGYYRDLESGLRLASEGIFENAIFLLDRCIAKTTNGSDAYFYKGAVLLARGDPNGAIQAWTTGTINFSFGRGYPPREDCAFVVSSVYLWLHTPNASLVYPRGIKRSTGYDYR